MGFGLGYKTSVSLLLLLGNFTLNLTKLGADSPEDKMRSGCTAAAAAAKKKRLKTRIFKKKKTVETPNSVTKKSWIFTVQKKILDKNIIVQFLKKQSTIVYRLKKAKRSKKLKSTFYSMRNLKKINYFKSHLYNRHRIKPFFC